jgi:hypothetical protein
MATFTNVDMLRARNAPAAPRALFGQIGDRVWPRLAPRPRAVLTARWLVAPEGRLTCRWQVKVSPRFGAPPD